MAGKRKDDDEAVPDQTQDNEGTIPGVAVPEPKEPVPLPDEPKAEAAPPKRGPGRPRKTPTTEMYAIGTSRPRKAVPKNPDKVPYRELAEQLCDWLIEATEGYPATSRFPVIKNTLSFAERLLPRRYVDTTKGRQTAA